MEISRFKSTTFCCILERVAGRRSYPASSTSQGESALVFAVGVHPQSRNKVQGLALLDSLRIWDSDPASFDAIVCLYTLIHVPLQDQRELIPRLRRWLALGGYLLVIVGHERWKGTEQYMGAPMFWDHADEATYLEWLHDAGFAVVWHRYVPEGTSGHTLVLARAERALSA